MDFAFLDGILEQGHSSSALDFPDVVKGRTVHIDADFLAYHSSYVSPNDNKSFDDMKHNCMTSVETLKNCAGAEHVHLHLTPSASNKGNRFNLAIQKEYQGNRTDDTKPPMLHTVRAWMAKAFPATDHILCEADDGMSSMQYAAASRGERLLSVICSKDKDLRMVPGLHLDWDTGILTGTEQDDDFGWVGLNDKRTKLIGYGQKFFWGQMLTGDQADNIGGLPLVSSRWMNAAKPTQQTIKQLEVMEKEPEDSAKYIKAKAAFDARKPGLCGAVLAEQLLTPMVNNRQAFRLVSELYKTAPVDWKHWKTGAPVTWADVFKSDAQLLWMRREPHNQNCVFNWFKEIMK